MGFRWRSGQAMVETAAGLGVVLLALSGLFLFSMLLARMSVAEMAVSSLCEYYASHLPPAPEPFFSARYRVRYGTIGTEINLPPGAYIVQFMDPRYTDVAFSLLVYRAENQRLRLDSAYAYPPNPKDRLRIECFVRTELVSARMPMLGPVRIERDMYKRQMLGPVRVERDIRYVVMSRWGW